jgi:hypothetical protein
MVGGYLIGGRGVMACNLGTFFGKGEGLFFYHLYRCWTRLRGDM